MSPLPLGSGVEERNPLRGVCASVLLMTALCSVSALIRAAGGTNSRRSVVSDEVLGLEMRAESGDLLFRRQGTFLSDTVLRFDAEGSFSHVGIIWRDGADVRVIHTVPTSGRGVSEGVQLDTVSAYLEDPETIAYALLRVDDDHRIVANQAADAALSYYARRIPFDTELRLDTPDRLYCTELVWRAYLDAGLALLPDLSARLTAVPLLRSEVLLPSTLQRSPHLHSVPV